MDFKNFTILDLNQVAQQLNNLTYTDYFYRLMLMARSVFKWNNLPNGINEKWIEEYLFGYGKCLFFHDKEKGFMVAKCEDSGEINNYDEPTLLRPYGTNYMGDPLGNGTECVLIRNNDAMLPTEPTLQLYALRLAEISRTIDVNIKAMKTPVLIKCVSDKQLLSLKRVYADFEGNEPAIFVDKDINLDGLDVLKTDAPIVFDKLQIQKHAIWNEAMTFLGINNANMDKRERLVDDEVQANNEQVGLSAEIMLKSRQAACEAINKLFGTNISVELRRLQNREFEGFEGVANNSKPFELVKGGEAV